MTIQHTRRVRRASAALAGGGLALGLLLAGCTSSGSSDGTAGSVAEAPNNAVPPDSVTAPAAGVDGKAAPAAPATGGTAGSGAGGTASKPGTTLPISALQRSVIYNGSITVRVKDVRAAANQAGALASGAGGYVGGDNRTESGGQSTATVQLRVPAARFDTTMTALGALGDEKDRQVSAQDVTQQVVDVGARLKTQQASVTRVRALLAQATSLTQIVSIEGELTQREADLESLEAQMAALTDQASLSTITAVLLGPEAAVTTVAKPHKGFVGGLTSGWHTFVSSVSVLLRIIGAILPFVVVIGVPLMAYWILSRRRRRVTRPALATAAAGPSAADDPAASA
jgi:hypothetical protein